MTVRDIFNDMHDIFERWVLVATDVYAKMSASLPVSADGTPISDSNPLSVTISDSNPLTVTGPLTDSELRETPVPTSGAPDEMEGDYVKGYWISNDMQDQTLVELRKISAHLAILTGEHDITGEAIE